VAPPLHDANLKLCHIETPIGAPDGEVLTGEVFSAPNELAAAIKDAGYDGCSTASNHSFDAGEEGLRDTLDALDAQGVGHAGTARSADEDAAVTVYDVLGIHVAHLAYTFGLDDAPLPAAESDMVSVIDPDKIGADARAAHAAGANIVVVSLHWGTDFTAEPTVAQVELAEQLSHVPEITLVIGHHAHVVQPITKVGDLVVAYGLGNFLSDQHESECCPAESQDGVIARFTFTETAPESGAFTVSDVAYTATRVDLATHTIVPVNTALANPGLDDDDRDVLDASRKRTDEAIGMLGLLAHPTGT
ncbi:MAG TPA: CapA family protein, partial [Acidimicrobiia bacterium]|nr:CapA family protein [Acidimicrobiia bacterium]